MAVTASALVQFVDTWPREARRGFGTLQPCAEDCPCTAGYAADAVGVECTVPSHVQLLASPPGDSSPAVTLAVPTERYSKLPPLGLLLH